MGKISVTIDLDTETLAAVVTKAKNLQDNDKIFAMLSSIAKPKSELKDALDTIEVIEREIKQAISDKARKLYGQDWSAITGKGYKIGRSMSGSVYEINGEPEARFVKVSTSVDSDAVTDFVKGNGSMPEGITVNPNRTEVIKLTIKPE